MKKNLLAAFVFALSSQLAWGINYYQTYDLVVSQSGNTLQCQVYDDVLAQTQSYSTGSLSGTVSYENSDGVLAYAAGSYVGFVTYDLQQHQFKSWSNSYSSGSTISTKDGTGAFASGAYVGAAIYDIVQGQWKTWTNSYSSNSTISTTDGVVAFASGSYVGALIYDPEQGQWKSWSNSYSANSVIENKDGLVAFASGSYVGALTYDAESAQWKSWSNSYNANSLISSDKGIMGFASGSYVGFITYDPANSQFKTYTNSYNSGSTILLSGRVGAFCSGSYVGAAAYDYTSHSWDTYSNSYSSPVAASLNITNGTVTCTTSGNAVSIGYNNGSWSSGQVTAIRPAYYLYNANTSSFRSHLVHVRNMSIGGTTVRFDFGDGVVATQSCLWHLYLINGMYRSTDYNVCMSAAFAGAGQSDCNTVTFEYSPVTAVNQNTVLQLSVTPNPASSYLSVQLEMNAADKESVTFELIDLAGRMILQQSLTSNIGRVYLKDVANGVYLYRVSANGGKVASDKLVIAH